MNRQARAFRAVRSTAHDHLVAPAPAISLKRIQGASLDVIQSGIFEISRRRGDGSIIVYGRVGPGEYVGEISMMSGDPRAVTVV